MIGRFVDAYVLAWVSPGEALAAVATGAITHILISASTTGAVSASSLLAIGLMNSIMGSRRRLYNPSE